MTRGGTTMHMHLDKELMWGAVAAATAGDCRYISHGGIHDTRPTV